MNKTFEDPRLKFDEALDLALLRFDESLGLPAYVQTFEKLCAHEQARKLYEQGYSMGQFLAAQEVIGHAATFHLGNKQLEEANAYFHILLTSFWDARTIDCQTLPLVGGLKAVLTIDNLAIDSCKEPYLNNTSLPPYNINGEDISILALKKIEAEMVFH